MPLSRVMGRQQASKPAIIHCSVSRVSGSSAAPQATAGTAIFAVSKELDENRFTLTTADSSRLIGCGCLNAETIWQMATDTFLAHHLDQCEAGKEAVYQITCTSPQDSQLLAHKLHEPVASKHEKKQQNDFASKTDLGSAELYFHYYGMLMHQQNMLQDQIRTGTYYAAILENPTDFQDKVVMDVGAGSGILSLFAAQAGARKVYAIEASGMAKYARQLVAASGFTGAVEIIQSKVEELALDAQVDVLVSEPMGTLLVNERMLETYLYARNRYLKKGGRMFPQVGRIHTAAFSDANLYAEVANKAFFWMQPSFYNIDITCLHKEAAAAYFTQVVVDAIDPSVIVSQCASKTFDFGSITDPELINFTIPLQLQIGRACVVHGIACWFDVLFDGSNTQRWLSTAPGQPTTHWFQLRCLMETPLHVQQGQVITGELRLAAHNRQSYDVFVDLAAPPLHPGQLPQKASGKFDLKEPYYRQLNPQTSAAWPQQEQTAQQAPPQQQQQSYVQQMHADSAQMQQSPNYGWSAQQPGVQQYPMMGHVSQDSRQQSDGHQWNQQAYQNMWQ
ncbi:TPA: hypothetical protein ACH3X2_004201 [Trebouxia sp. C0005]